MKSGRLIVLSLVMIFLFTGSPTQATTTLKIATLAPDGVSWMVMMREGAAEVKERTEGRVEIKFYPGGTMGNDASVLRKIRIGQLHGGMFTAGGMATVFPDFDIYTLPFAFNNYAEVDSVRRNMDGLLIDGLKEKGFISLGIAEGGFAYLVSNKPIIQLSDLNNQKVWMPEGDMMSQLVYESAGISPIPLPLTDVLTGLQTGLLDTVASSPVGIIALQWFTKVKYLTDIPLIYTYGTVSISAKAFNALSAEDQGIVKEVMGGTLKRLDKQARVDNEKALLAIKEQGIDFVKPNSEELGRWQAISVDVTQKLRVRGIYTEVLMDSLFRKIQSQRSAPAEVPQEQ